MLVFPFPATLVSSLTLLLYFLTPPTPQSSDLFSPNSPLPSLNFQVSTPKLSARPLVPLLSAGNHSPDSLLPLSSQRLISASLSPQMVGKTGHASSPSVTAYLRLTSPDSRVLGGRGLMRERNEKVVVKWMDSGGRCGEEEEASNAGEE